MKKRLKTWLIPSEENGYQPHALQRTAVLLMSVLVLMTFTFTNLQALVWMNSSWLVSTVLPAIVVDLTNESRASEALGGLTRNETLDRAAQLKAEHMAENGYFAHYAPDGTSPWYFFESVGYQYQHAGENLAVHFTDSDEVVEAWLLSPTHRANIMSGDYREIGVGTAKGEYQGYPTVFVVQLFGTPVPGNAPTPSAPQPLAAAPTEAPAPIPEPEPISEPEPAPVEPAPVPEMEPLPLSEPETVPVAEEVTPTERAAEEPPAVIVSDTVATTNQNVAGLEFRPPSVTENPLSTIGRVATQPQAVLNFVYSVTAVFVLGALMLSILIEIRKQHPVQIAYGTGLLAMMALLTYVHSMVAGGVLIA